MHPVDSTAPSQKLELALTPERFPFQLRGKKIEISKVELFLDLKDGVKPGTNNTYTEIYTEAIPFDVLFTPLGGNAVSLQSSQSFLNRMPYCATTLLGRSSKFFFSDTVIPITSIFLGAKCETITLLFERKIS
ncbi:hypothetical protein LC653_25860 [Nostoc sp. CHAB 5784]|uniref:hypothetical protein n=1 Tax=Nostoc mirabile TaxID=2907820 RepID=UPI001E42EB0E|nr:hypothetical protein [Nostoc mirabile]MCC5667219.1 hypothetical protein [Nostoc mirabile CHAB5784]